MSKEPKWEKPDVETILAIIRSDFKRLDGDFMFWGKKYKFSAYVINQFGSGNELYRIDIREVKT